MGRLELAAHDGRGWQATAQGAAQVLAPVTRPITVAMRLALANADTRVDLYTEGRVLGGLRRRGLVEKRTRKLTAGGG